MEIRVRFDDRLATVLSQSVESPHERAVRWRQLVDLVARADAGSDRGLLKQAIDLIRADQAAIREPIRAAAARSIAGSPVPLALLTVFAADNLAVAAPLIASASLKGDALSAVRSAASSDVKRFFDSLSGPVAEPRKTVRAPPKFEAEANPEPEPGNAPRQEPGLLPEYELVPSIPEVVARIERLRLSRAQAPTNPAPGPPTSQPPVPPVSRPQAYDPPVLALFRWECGAGGEIEWVEGVPRGPLIGRSIANADRDGGVDESVERAFTVRAPFRDCVLDLGSDGLIAGEW